MTDDQILGAIEANGIRGLDFSMTGDVDDTLKRLGLMRIHENDLYNRCVEISERTDHLLILDWEVMLTPSGWAERIARRFGIEEARVPELVRMLDADPSDDE